MNKEKLLKIKSLRRVIIFCVIFIWLIFLIILSNFFNDRLLSVYDQINFSIFLKNKAEQKSEEKALANAKISVNAEILEKDIKDKTSIGIKSYEAFLELPILNLKKGLANINSKNNDMSKNVMIVKNSKYPNIKNSNISLVSGCGSEHNAFFGNLNKLKKEDKMFLYYANKKYSYRLKKKYTNHDSENVIINKSDNVRTLTLITCKKKDKTEQLVIIGELVNIGNYK